MVSKDGRFYGAAHHALADKYVLQIKIKGTWETIRERNEG